MKKRRKNVEDEPLWQKVAWRIPSDNEARKENVVEEGDQGRSQASLCYKSH